MQPDKRFPFHVTAAPLEGRGQFLLLTKRALAVQALPGTQCLIEGAVSEEACALIKRSPANELARQWDVSDSTIHRIREALGLAAEYTGESKTTIWRKRRGNSDDSNEEADSFDNKAGDES